MGKVIISTQMTVDGVIDSTDWFIPDGEHQQRGFEQLLAAEALLLGRKTYEVSQVPGPVSPTTADGRSGSTTCRSSSPRSRWKSLSRGTRR